MTPLLIAVVGLTLVAAGLANIAAGLYRARNADWSQTSFEGGMAAGTFGTGMTMLVAGFAVGLVALIWNVLA